MAELQKGETVTKDKFTYWGWAVTIYTSMTGVIVAEAQKDDRGIILDRSSMEEARVSIKQRIEQRENSFRKARG